MKTPCTREVYKEEKVKPQFNNILKLTVQMKEIHLYHQFIVHKNKDKETQLFLLTKTPQYPFSYVKSPVLLPGAPHQAMRQPSLNQPVLICLPRHEQLPSITSIGFGK